MLIDTKSYDTRVVLNWYKVQALSVMPKNKIVFFPDPDGGFFEGRVKSLANRQDIKEYVGIVLDEWKSLFYWTSFVWLLYPFFLYTFALRTKKQLETEYVRGAKIIEAKQHRKLTKRITTDRKDIPIGNVFMPCQSEIRMTLSVGRPGTGKTVLYNQIMAKILERDEKAMVYDVKGDYFCKFFRPEKDILLNPLDKRSIGWNIFNEIRDETDFAAFAASIIPQDPKEIAFWTNGPRAVFTGILTYLLTEEKTSNADLWNLLTSKASKIHKCLKTIDHFSLRYIEDPESRQTQGVLSKLIEHTSCFAYLKDIDGDFCISDWVQNDSVRSMLYLTTSETVQETLRPLLSLWIDIAVLRLLEMPDNLDRRRFFMIDEFGTLQRLNMIIKGLTLSRSKGGAFFLAIQDTGILDDVYGKLRQTIINACGNFITFAVEDNDVAEFCSAKFAEKEEIVKTRNLSIGVSEFRDGVNVSQQRRKERLLIPAEIKELPDLTAVVKIASVTLTDQSNSIFRSHNKSIVLPPVIARLKYVKRPVLWAQFEQREALNIDKYIGTIQGRVDMAERIAKEMDIEFIDLPIEEPVPDDIKTAA